MESPPPNPNEALTAMFVGDKLVFVPVTEYYLYRDRPLEALAHFAIEKAIEEDEETT